ncbi:hypothetical protein AAVH_12454 [Aphelenchoides avenae]|nr:hypothetical protein AAVH_12454 [Aphelenchus avenae]
MVLRDANYIFHNYDSDYDSILFNVNRFELFYFRVIHYIKHFNTKHCDSCNYTAYNYGFYHYNHTYKNSVDSIDGDHHTNDSKYKNLYEFN